MGLVTDAPSRVLGEATLFRGQPLTDNQIVLQDMASLKLLSVPKFVMSQSTSVNDLMAQGLPHSQASS